MRILVGLIEHMGDIVACEPVARYLKFNHPDAHLSWAVSPAYRELVDTNPYIDETIVLECLTDWIKLQSHDRYDRIVDLHVNNRICQHCQIPLAKRTGNPFVNAYEWFDYGALLEAFTVGAGLPRLSAQPRLYLRLEHAGAVDALRLPERFCVLHRFSNSEQKDWTDAGWQGLASIIQDELKLPIVEVGAGKAIGGLSPIPGATDLVNRLPILQTAEVIRRAALFVGIDSGPAHLANAQQVPGVILLGRMGFFRQYTPYTGFYAGTSPRVKLVRNLIGPVREIDPKDAAEAVRYVVAADGASPSSPLPDLPSPGDWSAPSAGGHEVIAESGLFDVGWYAVNYPEAAAGRLHPIDHYIETGASQGYSPSKAFDTKAYFELVPGLAATGTNPLLYYIANGWSDGFRLPPQDAGPDGAPRAGAGGGTATISAMLAAGGAEPPIKSKGAGTAPRIFAFYLPQFHPIPENDWAHGRGFTEWHNVVKAKPLFPGHYQPRVPGELGFYDLRAQETLREQIRLAQEHSVSGFCFYYYYFQGKKLLYTPLDNFIRSDIDAPFLLLWANENWSKRWDGGDREIIIAQQHSKDDDLAFLRELAPTFHDRRYVKIDGKPVLMVYKTHLFPNTLATTELWREEIQKLGFPGIYLIMADDWSGELNHPRDLGFDASYEIPSNVTPRDVLSTETQSMNLAEDFTGQIVDYAKFAGFHLGRPFPAYKRIRTVMLPWDNTARYASRAIVHVNAHGDSYRLWLLQALLDTYRRHEPDERLVFLHSWNEWCEGTYLEPDGKYGRFFLEETREAVRIADEAIGNVGNMPAEQLAASLLRVQAAKDEGAFRVMSTTRMQTHYAYGDVVRERREAASLRDESNHLRYKAARLEAELRDARASAEVARAAVESVRNSTSWRLTGPLRKISRMLHGR